MPYTVNKTNSSASPSSYTVQDGVVNTQTDLSLIGKGYAGYGELCKYSGTNKTYNRSIVL